LIERLHKRQLTEREQRRGRDERSHPDQPSRSNRADRSRSARVDQRQYGGREREAG
jgi:hypothetical protein